MANQIPSVLIFCLVTFMTRAKNPAPIAPLLDTYDLNEPPPGGLLRFPRGGKMDGYFEGVGICLSMTRSDASSPELNLKNGGGGR